VASKEDLSEQLGVSQKLAAQIERMAIATERVEKSYAAQVDIITKLAGVMSTVNTQDAAAKIDALSKALQGVQDKSKESGQATEKAFQKLGKQAESVGKTIKDKFPKSVLVATGALSGFNQGIRNLVANAKSISGFFGSFVDGLVNVTASIIAIPFKIFEGLVDLAAKAGGGSTELAEAIEALRKQFGALGGPTNKAIVSVSTNLKGFSDTGLNSYRIFGNLAKRLNDLRELATEMGGTFGKLTKQFEDNGGAILAYQKGLGLSNEDMKGMAANAIALGQDVTVALKDMTKQSYALGKAFGLDAKLISRDMGKAMNDVKHFGGATVKQIAEASTYARKLGFELKDITGTLDAFETFDSAAENAAKLSQSFGLNIDAFKMMEAQSPAEQLDMLRKSFRDAGVDASNFNRAQLKLVAGTTGLTEAQVKQGLSMKNEGMRLDEIKKKSGEAEKKTMTQAEAMKTLADAIERLVQSGGSQTGGFWDMFVKGFLGGLQSSKEFREIIWNIKRALQETYMQGVRLGKAFVEMFPGVKQLFGGIAEFFQPAKFKKMVGGVVDVIEDWMKGLTANDGRGSFGGLMKNIQSKFFSFLDGESPASKNIIEGFKKFFKTFTKVAAEGIKWASEKIAEGIKWVIDLITGKVTLPGAGAAQGTLGFLGEALMPLLDALKHAGKMIGPPLWGLLKTVGGMIKDFLMSDGFLNVIKPALPYVAAILFGPAFARAVLGAITSSLVSGAGGFLASGGKKMIEKLTGQAQAVADSAKKVGGGGSASDVSKVGDVNKATGEAIKPTGSKDWGVKDADKLGAKLVAIAAALAIGGVMMAYSIGKMKKILSSSGINKPEDAAAPLMVLGVMVLAAIPLMFAMKLADKAGSASEIIKGGAVIALAVGIVGLVGTGLAYVMKQVGKPAELQAAGDLMLKMSLVFLAMVPLILASMAIGALASGPQAIALAAAAAGLVVIGVAVGGMAGMAVGIVKELSVLQVDASFQRKIDAFLSIMKSIQAFTETLVKVIDLMTPTFTEFVTGNSQSFSKKAESARGLIGEMIGSRDKQNGMIGIVDTVMKALRELNFGTGMGEKASIFASVLTAIGAVMTAMTPPPGFFEAGSTFLAGLSGPKPFADLATDVNTYMNNMRTGIMTMINGEGGKGGIIEIIKTLSEINIPNTKATEVVGALMGSIANVMKAITPSGDTLKGFTKSVEGALVAVGPLKIGSQSISKLDTAGMADSMRAMGESMKNILPTLTTGVLAGVLATTKDMNPADMEKLKVAAEVLKTSIDAGKLISEAFKDGGAAPAINPTSIDSLTSMLPAAFAKVADLQKNIGASVNATSLRAFGKNLGDMTSVIKGDGKGGVTGALTAIGDMISQANALNEALSSSKNVIDIKAKLGQVASAVGLGGKASYTVNPSKEVKITVNLQVTMDAGVVERVIIERKESIIRDRLNFATNSPHDKGNSVISDTPGATPREIKSTGTQ